MSPIQLDAGEGGASLRMTGEGSIGLGEPKIALKLEGRRLDADSFILSSNGQDFKSRLAQWSVPTLTVPLDLDLKIDSVGLGQEDIANATARLTIDRGQARIERIGFTAPGETQVAIEGEAGLGTQGGAEGRVSVSSRTSDRLARYLDRLGIRSPFLKVLDGRPFEFASDVSLAYPIVSLSRLRVKTGDATLTGNVRYTEPEARARGRLEAQVSVLGLNLDQLPQVSSVFEATQNLDVGFILDARDVKAGNRPGIGRISARILSDGPALRVETLDIVNLAGANAKVSGRIAPDGSGRIAGKVTAQRAAPVIDLLGSVWIGGLSRLVPPFLREGDLNLDVVSERVPPTPGTAELRLRTTANGIVAGGGFASRVDSLDGRTETLEARLTTENTGRWVGRTDVPALRKPSTLNLKGARVPSGLFNVTLDGDVGGVQIATTRPFTLSAGDDVVDTGEADLTAADVSPFPRPVGRRGECRASGADQDPDHPGPECGFDPSRRIGDGRRHRCPGTAVGPLALRRERAGERRPPVPVVARHRAWPERACGSVARNRLGDRALRAGRTPVHRWTGRRQGEAPGPRPRPSGGQCRFRPGRLA